MVKEGEELSKEQFEEMLGEKDKTQEEIKQEEQKIKDEAEENKADTQEEELSEPKCNHDPDTLQALARERADFLNYKARVAKEQEKMREMGKKDAIRSVLPVLDEISRVKAAGDLEENSPFAKIVAKLEEAVEKLGVLSFGIKGDEFDHNLHEAILNKTASDDLKIEDGKTLIDEVVENGYKFGDEILRTAKVITISNE